MRFFLDFLGFCRWRKKNRNQLRLNITSVNWDTIKGPIKALIRGRPHLHMAFVFCIVMIHYPPLIYFFWYIFLDRLESYFMDRKLIIIILHFKTIMALVGALWDMGVYGTILEYLKSWELEINPSQLDIFIWIFPNLFLRIFPSDPFQINPEIIPLR